MEGDEPHRHNDSRSFLFAKSFRQNRQKGLFVLLFENTIKPVIRGHSTVHLQISMFDKVSTSMWPARRILFIDGEVPK